VTQPQDPRKHPLQDDEVALARVLRALSAVEPPASVDDAILRAATDAVTPGRRKPARGLPWLPTWAIGTAAAAVLAVGIGVQLRPPLQPEAAPASVSEAVKPLPQARERLSVELVEPDEAAVPPPASAPPAPPAARRNSAPPPPPPPPAPLSPQAPAPVMEPAPPTLPAEAAEPALADAPSTDSSRQLDSVEVTGSRLRSEATDQARRVHQEAYARRAQAKASALASAREEDAARAAVSGANEAMPQATFTAPAPAAAAPTAGAMADAAAVAEEAGILPPVADDARLAPDAWLDRIRERRRQGDTAGARASLRLFLQAYPGAPVPSDLARLR
jgi:hypothetical protein